MSHAAVLLAGGYSRRMGSDKASLPWGRASLLQHQAATLRATGARDWILACRPEQQFALPGFKLVPDPEPDRGPMAALANVWKHTQTDVLLVLAVDMPFAPAAWLRQLAIMADREGQSVLPASDSVYEPLAAAWHRSCLPHWHSALKSSRRSFQTLSKELAAYGKLREITIGKEETRWLTNLNCPADFSRHNETRSSLS